MVFPFSDSPNNALSIDNKPTVGSDGVITSGTLADVLSKLDASINNIESANSTDFSNIDQSLNNLFTENDVQDLSISELRSLINAEASKIDVSFRNVDVSKNLNVNENVIVKGYVDVSNIKISGTQNFGKFLSVGAAYLGTSETYLLSGNRFGGLNMAEAQLEYNQTTNVLSIYYLNGNSVQNLNNLSVRALETNFTGKITGPAEFIIDPAVVGDDTGKVVIRGGLDVLGTTTTINSSVIDLSNLFLTLASNTTGNPSSALESGVEIERGDLQNAKLVWREDLDKFEFRVGNSDLAVLDISQVLIQGQDIKTFFDPSWVFLQNSISNTGLSDAVRDVSINSNKSSIETIVAENIVRDASNATHNSRLNVLDTSFSGLEASANALTSELDVVDLSLQEIRDSLNSQISKIDVSFRHVDISENLNVDDLIVGGLGSAIANWRGMKRVGLPTNAYAIKQNHLGDTTINSADGRSLSFNQANDVKMALSNGNLGLGISSSVPTRRLDVSGDVLLRDKLDVSGALNVDGTAKFYNYVEASNLLVGGISTGDWAGIKNKEISQGVGYAVLQNSSGRTIINALSTQNIEFRKSAVLKAIIKGDHFGIGTNDPKALLHVAGDASFNGIVEVYGDLSNHKFDAIDASLSALNVIELNDISGVKQGGSQFSQSLKIGEETTGTLNNALANTIIGFNVGNAISSATFNTLIGNNTGNSLNIGTGNTAVGINNLADATSAQNNVAIGFNTLNKNQVHDYNVAIGYNALRDTKADNNIGIGNSAARDNDAGSGNICLGTEAFKVNNGSNNIAIGGYTGQVLAASSTMSNCIHVGTSTYTSNVSATDASYEIIIGSGSIGKGSNTTVLGSVNKTHSAYIYGDLCGNTTINAIHNKNNSQDSSISTLVSQVAQNIADVTVIESSLNLIEGRQTVQDQSLIELQVIQTITENSLNLIDTRQIIQDQSLIELQVVQSITDVSIAGLTQVSQVVDISIALHDLSLAFNQQAVELVDLSVVQIESSFIQLNLNDLQDCTDLSNNIVLGSSLKPTSGANNNIILGNGGGNMGDKDENVYIGFDAGTLNNNNFNSFVGSAAGKYNEGNNNTFIGRKAGEGNANGGNTGSINVAIGARALRSAETTASCVGVGPNALSDFTGGFFTVGIGRNSGKDVTNGSGNVFVGYEATKLNGGTANNCIVIGSQAEGINNAVTIGKEGTHTLTRLVGDISNDSLTAHQSRQDASINILETKGSIVDQSINLLQISEQLQDASINAANITKNTITLTGQLNGPSDLIIDPATVGNNSGKVTILGDLDVQGVTTTINSQQVDISDTVIKVASNVTGTPPSTLEAGLEVERGSSDNASLIWNEAADKWQLKVGSSLAKLDILELQLGGSNILQAFDASWAAINASNRNQDASLSQTFDIFILNAAKMAATDASVVILRQGLAATDLSIVSINSLQAIQDISINATATALAKSDLSINQIRSDTAINSSSIGTLITQVGINLGDIDRIEGSFNHLEDISVSHFALINNNTQRLNVIEISSNLVDASLVNMKTLINTLASGQSIIDNSINIHDISLQLNSLSIVVSDSSINKISTSLVATDLSVVNLRSGLAATDLSIAHLVDTSNAHFTLINTNTTGLANSDLSINAIRSTVATNTATLTGKLSHVVNDSTPQLGGNLDVNSQEIVSTSNSNVKINPDGTGVLEIMGNSSESKSGQIQLNCENNSHGVKIVGPPHSAGASYSLTLPNDTGSNTQVLQTDGNGNLSWANNSGGSAGITVQEEGSSLTTAATTLNFVGSGVTASGTGATKTITISGSGGGGGGSSVGSFKCFQTTYTNFTNNNAFVFTENITDPESCYSSGIYTVATAGVYTIIISIRFYYSSSESGTYGNPYLKLSTDGGNNYSALNMPERFSSSGGRTAGYIAMEYLSVGDKLKFVIEGSSRQTKQFIGGMHFFI